MTFKKKFSLIMFLFYALFCYTQTETENDYDKNSRDDMNAILHYTAGFRFGSNLKVGDFVKYKTNERFGNKQFITLEVTKKDDKGVWIKEVFDGNEIHMHIDNINGKLLELWGYDEDKNYREYESISENTVTKRIQKIKQKVVEGTYSDGIIEERNRKNIKTSAGNFNCLCFSQSYDINRLSRSVSTKELNRFKNETKMYFSSDIPQLYPFLYLATQLIGKDESFRDSNLGLVKNHVIELTEVRRGEENE